MDMGMDQSHPGRSPIHRMDTRLKLVGFAVLLCTTALLRSLPSAAVAFALSWFWVFLSRLPLRPILRRTGIVVLFLSSFFLILPFSHPAGRGAGLHQAATIVLKGAAMIVMIFPMFHTAPFHVSIKALERLKLSSKVVTLSLLTYRYVATYQEALGAVRVSMSSRGFRPRGDLRTLRIVGNLIGSLLLRSFEQTERIFQAMRSRGYGQSFGVHHEFPALQRYDWFKLALMILMSLALLGLEFNR